MTVQEFIAELEHWKKEAAGFKHQMEVNLDYCKRYESALITIVNMCGNETPYIVYGHPEDIEEMAIKHVKELVEKQKPVSVGL